MRTRILIATILIGSLLGCGQTHQNTNKLSTSEKSDTNSTKIDDSVRISSPTESPLVLETPTTSSITVAEAAQLTSSQVKELLLVAAQKILGRDFRIFVPTYIPQGFQVDRVGTDPSRGRGGPPSCVIIYQNFNSGVCFSVTGSSGGNPPTPP